MTCTHESIYWYPAVNEDGWKCVDCGAQPGEPPGFSPVHDRERLFHKVDGILRDLHEAGIIHVSSGSEGMAIAEAIEARCRDLGLYDQYTIASQILLALAERHAKYWAKVSDGILSGSDPRERCACGALGTVKSGNDPWQCHDCYRRMQEEDAANRAL